MSLLDHESEPAVGSAVAWFSSRAVAPGDPFGVRRYVIDRRGDDMYLGAAQDAITVARVPRNELVRLLPEAFLPGDSPLLRDWRSRGYAICLYRQIFGPRESAFVSFGDADASIERSARRWRPPRDLPEYLFNSRGYMLFGVAVA